MMINIATVAGVTGTLLSALSSCCVSPHAFSVFKGTLVLQEEEVLESTVADGVTDGAVGVDDTTTGSDEEDEGENRGIGVIIHCKR